MINQSFCCMQMILTWIRIFNVTNEYFDILYFTMKLFNMRLLSQLCLITIVIYKHIVLIVKY